MEHNDRDLAKIQPHPHTFSPDTQQQAEREIQTLFSEQAKTSLRHISAYAITVFGWLAILIIAAAALTRAAHLLLPTAWLWLSPDRIDQIDRIILAVVAGIASRYFPIRK